MGTTDFSRVSVVRIGIVAGNAVANLVCVWIVLNCWILCYEV